MHTDGLDGRPHHLPLLTWRRRINRSLATLAAGVLSCLLPPFCVRCGPLVEAAVDGVCVGCRDALTLFDDAPQCASCARPLDASANSRGRCLTCARRRPTWSDLDACAPYDGVLRELVVTFKYGRRVELGRCLAKLVARRHGDLRRRRPSPVDCIVPVPLSPDRRRWRGFNQSAELAAGLPEIWDAPLCPEGLERHDGGRQTGLGAALRRRMPAQAFRPGHGIWGRRVLLFDDVLTTGATLRAATAALFEGGALDVRAAVLARTAERRPS